jgi:tetraacyldisaccharide-1-P 4'-kinase
VEGVPVAGARFAWEPELQPEGSGALAVWAGRKVLLMAGVGNAGSFLSQAAAAGFDPERALLLPDHAWPTRERIAQVGARLAQERCEAVLTTEKDAVKWAPLWAAPQPLLWCRLKTDFEDPSGHLRRALESALGGRP